MKLVNPTAEARFYDLLAALFALLACSAAFLASFSALDSAFSAFFALSASFQAFFAASFSRFDSSLVSLAAQSKRSAFS
jgi:hypothetical protein